MNNFVRYAGVMLGCLLCIHLMDLDGSAESIRLNSGRTLESDMVWLENGKANCQIREINIAFALEQVDYIRKDGGITQEDMAGAEENAVKILFDIHQNEPAALDRLFSGKSIQRVEGYFGSPDGKQQYGPYQLWQYGGTGTIHDIAVIVFQNTVAEITFY